MNVDSKNKKEKYSLIDLRNEMSKMAQQTKPEKAYGQLGSLSTDLKRSGYEINCSYRFNSKLLYKASINTNFNLRKINFGPKLKKAKKLYRQ